MSEQYEGESPHGRREIIVTHMFSDEIDVDRLDEWVDANFPKGRVQIMDKQSREVLYDDI